MLAFFKKRFWWALFTTVSIISFFWSGPAWFACPNTKLLTDGTHISHCRSSGKNEYWFSASAKREDFFVFLDALAASNQGEWELAKNTAQTEEYAFDRSDDVLVRRSAYWVDGEIHYSQRKPIVLSDRKKKECAASDESRGRCTET
ncbi:hypothetical protein [Shimia sp.]|uniref:hypothetical protein n=1 Tax=unclassified Shimia TaxID=2630038 RepID=UPI0025F27C78|nr:hypothetical protein [Shimia sp.]MCH2067803.1 hypothetical protein [Shimia sp.]